MVFPELSLTDAELLAKFQAAGEDRNRREWRSIGETCLQPGPQSSSLAAILNLVLATA